LWGRSSRRGVRQESTRAIASPRPCVECGDPDKVGRCGKPPDGALHAGQLDVAICRTVNALDHVLATQ
jgi:hypothetical protein